MSDYTNLIRSDDSVEFTLEVRDPSGSSMWDVHFDISDSEMSAAFRMDQATHVRGGATSPDDLLVGWLTWAAEGRTIAAFAAPYIGYAGWLVLPIDGPEEDGDDEIWVGIAKELLSRIALLDHSDNPLWLNAAADRVDAPQGRAYAME